MAVWSRDICRRKSTSAWGHPFHPTNRSARTRAIGRRSDEGQFGSVLVVFEATGTAPDLAPRVDIATAPGAKVAGVSALAHHFADRARASAQRAAHAAGVTVRPLDGLAEVVETEQLLTNIWRPSDGAAPVAADLLRGLVSAASYVAGAFDDDGLLGVCVGFWGPPGSGVLHSHIAGVHDRSQGRNVGWALKLDQRAFALEAGVASITWTYDPLVSRNAHFNLRKLGGRPAAYYVNYYGPMLDALNGLDDSDRFLLRWDLTTETAIVACDGSGSPSREGAPRPDIVDLFSDPQIGVMLRADETDRPVELDSDSDCVLVAIPGDIERLRREDPDAARQWRAAVRTVMTRLLDAGGRVEDYDREQCAYIVTRGTNR